MSATVHHITALVDRNRAVSISVHAYVRSILEAANSLLRDGNMTIIAFQATGHPPTPTIWVHDCPYVRNLARVGLAQYERQGRDEHGAYRVGQFTRCGVFVEWIERVPS